MELTKAQAIEYTGLDPKTFGNYYQSAEEFSALPRSPRGRFKFDSEVLSAWKKDHKARTVTLDLSDYALAMDFALAQHFRGYVQSDFGTGRQREFGQKITNWVKGQLGEIAVQKFLKQTFGVEIELDFDIHEEIVPQDVKSVFNKRAPKIGVGIKASKPKNAFLILGENEIRLEERRSDVYVYARPNLPDDHILRITKERIQELVKGQQYFSSSYGDKIPSFSNIPCEIAGWCHRNELTEVTSIPGQTFDTPRFVRASGRLRRTEKDWRELIDML